MSKYPSILNYFVFNEKTHDNFIIKEPSLIQYEKASSLAEVHSKYNSLYYWAEDSNQWISRNRLILFGVELGYDNGYLHTSRKDNNICWMVDREGVVWISAAKADKTLNAANFNYLTGAIQFDNNFDIHVKEFPPIQLLERFQAYIANVVGVEKTYRQFSSLRKSTYESSTAENAYLAVYYGYTVFEFSNSHWNIICSGLTQYEAYSLSKAVEQTNKETKIIS